MYKYTVHSDHPRTNVVKNTVFKVNEILLSSIQQIPFLSIQILDHSYNHWKACA